MSLVEVTTADRVATLTLNNPAERNTLTAEMVAGITAAMDEIESDDGIGALVVTGAPPVFCAGANLFAVLWALALYVGGRRRGHAGTGNVVKDVWMGVELNPTWGGVDLKTFAYQPSLIGLGLLIAAFAYAQHEAIGQLTPQMVLYQAFWWLYLFTHYRDEAGILSMYDVIAMPAISVGNGTATSNGATCVTGSTK